MASLGVAFLVAACSENRATDTDEAGGSVGSADGGAGGEADNEGGSAGGGNAGSPGGSTGGMLTGLAIGKGSILAAGESGAYVSSDCHACGESSLPGPKGPHSLALRSATLANKCHPRTEVYRHVRAGSAA